MIRSIYYFLLVILLYYLINSCANPASPTGGPRDTIPPVRINTIPEHKSINYKGKTIVMEYDERIKTDNIKDQLIITPLIESDYEYTLKKNTIKLEFEESFRDSTTYTLNFRESIQDITESNPTEDNKFTFSTGSFIDSMSITGYVKELLTYDTLENVTVGLYKANDTITIFNGSPYYFTELDEEGAYLIENIKNGRYLLYAFLDDNKNLLLETNNEAYGFVKDTILLDTGLMTQNIDLIRLDLNDLKMLTALPSGKYYEINLNKYITEYSITPIGNNHKFYANRSKKNKSIRFYNNFSDVDSLLVSFTAKDSVNNMLSDTLYVKFSDSKRNPDEFTVNVSPENNSAIDNSLNVRINFNKPIISVNTDSMFVQFDTTKIADIHDSLFNWNDHLDQLEFKLEIDRAMADTILSRRDRLKQMMKDSLEEAQKNVQVKQQISKDKQQDLPKLNRGLQLYFGTGSFYSADMDTSKAVGMNYKFIIPDEHGIQDVNIETSYEKFIVQLVSENFEIEREIRNKKSIQFRNIKPGSYKVRVLIDANNDGEWSPGNMKKQIEPEPVYIYPEVLVIRADWQTSLDIAF